MRTAIVTIIMLLTFLISAPSYADLILESWESPSVAAGSSSTVLPTSWLRFSGGINNSRVFHPSNTAYFNQVQPLAGPAAGNQLLLLHGTNTGIYRLSGIFIQANTAYELSAAIGNSNMGENSQFWSLQLWADTNNSGVFEGMGFDSFIGQQFGGNVEANLPAAGEWAFNSFLFNSETRPDLVGKQLIIFPNNYYEAGTSYYDNVSLRAATEPNSEIVAKFIVHSGWTGTTGDWIDRAKALAKEQHDPQTLGFDNVINSAHGINGLQFNIQNLQSSSLTASDFVFRMSPQGAFTEGEHPADDWDIAPAPSSITVTEGKQSQVLIQWPNNAIENRWMRVTLKANANTGLAQSETYYIGHLLGETTGLEGNGIYSVSFSDIIPIRSDVGSSVDASSINDIDKDGLVSFSDIGAMRSNVGTQLTNITVSSSGD